MSQLLPPAVAISIASVTTPKPPSAGEGNYRFLAGIGLFEVEQAGPGEFCYRLAVRTIPAGASEAVLADWLMRNLPADRAVIGWDLAEAIVPALFEAAQSQAPQAAADLIDLLSSAVTRDAMDLADLHGGLAAPSFDQVCAALGIATSSMSEGLTLGAWGTGQMNEIAGMLAADAVAVWRLWSEHRRPQDTAPHRFAADILAQWNIEAAGGSCWNAGETGHG